MKLTIELVPKTAWFSNVRSMVKKSDWDFLRKEAYKQSDHKCSICGGVGSRWPVEAHEIWGYNDNSKVQTLKGIIALCPACHQAKHIGLAFKQGFVDGVIDHLSRVNNISVNEVLSYIKDVFDVWEKRNQFKWECDLSWLEEKNISYTNERE